LFPASAPHARPRRILSDAAKKRDPTQSNDIRRRISTNLRQGLAAWRSQIYAAVVEADQFGYVYGDVDRGDAEALIERLDTLLHRGAEFAFTPAADQMDVMLGTAYARGVRKAGQEVQPVMPLTSSTFELAQRARDDLENMLEDRIAECLRVLREDEDTAAAATSSRYLLYTALLLPTVIRPLVSRLNALSTTNVTRAYNTGKLDAYEVLGIDEVGVQAESQPSSGKQLSELLAEHVREQAAEQLLHEHLPSEEFSEPVLPEGQRFPEFYTVETVGDDRVCDICEGYEGNTYTLAEARELIPAHPNCRCSIVPVA
jgi:hypothetical protein